MEHETPAPGTADGREHATPDRRNTLKRTDLVAEQPRRRAYAQTPGGSFFEVDDVIKVKWHNGFNVDDGPWDGPRWSANPAANQGPPEAV